MTVLCASTNMTSSHQSYEYQNADAQQRLHSQMLVQGLVPPAAPRPDSGIASRSLGRQTPAQSGKTLAGSVNSLLLVCTHLHRGHDSDTIPLRESMQSSFVQGATDCVRPFLQNPQACMNGHHQGVVCIVRYA